MNEEESYLSIALILRKIYKEVTGDDDVPISEILEVYRYTPQKYILFEIP